MGAEFKIGVFIFNFFSSMHDWWRRREIQVFTQRVLFVDNKIF